jgi:radical SAM/Cys-rich protein
MSVLGEDVSPRKVRSLLARRTPLADPAEQLRVLGEVTLEGGDFEEALRQTGREGLHAAKLRVFQINLGKLCNMTCRHCHVDAGPDRTTENMDAETVDACIEAIERSRPEVVDLTGGAPELNPHFRRLVDACVALDVDVIDRCNLSVLLLRREHDLAEFLAERGVEVVASLPHPRRSRTDAQRGDGAWRRSIEGLKRLNAVGYGQGDPERTLTLMHNPSGAFLPSGQASMEREWKDILLRDHGIRFDRLIALNNMPIARYLEWLQESGNLQPYMERLVGAFNPGTIDGLMCRDTVSVGWDGRLYDCDFNQMLALAPEVEHPHVRDFARGEWVGRRIVTERHCFGCTAGAGSSCAGATS